MELDYQDVVNVIIAMMGVSAPLVIILGLAGKLYNAFVSAVIGKEYINL